MSMSSVPGGAASVSLACARGRNSQRIGFRGDRSARRIILRGVDDVERAADRAPRRRGNVVLEFGTRIPGVSYVDRPGAYAIIRAGSNAIALVRTPQGFLLPGGGVQLHEPFDEALQRELMEEIGYRSRIGKKLCAAVQYLYSEVDHGYFKKVGHFFAATLTARVGEPTELDHELVWCPPDEAVTKLAQEFQAWAIRYACGMAP
jgi:8-oxo-dGTP diphosphatase